MLLNAYRKANYRDRGKLVFYAKRHASPRIDEYEQPRINLGWTVRSFPAFREMRIWTGQLKVKGWCKKMALF